MLSVKQGGIEYYSRVFGKTRPGIESQSHRPLANILIILSMGRSLSLYIYSVCHFKSIISHMCFVYFRFCLLCCRLKSVGRCLWRKQHNVAIHISRNLDLLGIQDGNTYTKISKSLGNTLGIVRGFEKSWMSSLVITKVRQIRKSYSDLSD